MSETDFEQVTARLSRAIEYVKLLLSLTPHVFPGACWSTLTPEQRDVVSEEAAKMLIAAATLIEGALPRAPAVNGNETSIATPPVHEEIHSAVASTFPGQYL